MGQLLRARDIGMPEANDCWDFFAALDSSKSQGAYVCKRIDSLGIAFLTKDQLNRPLFLVQDGAGIRKPTLELENVHVEYGLQCRVTDEVTTSGGVFTAITCTNTDNTLQELFVRCFSDMLGLWPSAVVGSEVDRYIRSLVELFRGLGRPNLKGIRGLWAELNLIASCKQQEFVLRAWHTDPTDTFDFSFPGFHMEVKSSESIDRVHHFSLQQIRPADGARVYVVSSPLQSNPSGTSVIELTERISARAARDSALREKLWRNVFATLGSEIRAAKNSRFSEEYARKQLQACKAIDLPWYPTPAPPGVLDINARIAFSSVAPTSVLKFDELEQLFI
jgi:hypothetical protein